ncbi:unnamed protein product [Sphagnum jensenii]|uniref:Uncharacterized protein n=1 Tax=Sphagnum jensenii TaxID=128206 RepID=A0ABP1AR72_9BRYO
MVNLIQRADSRTDGRNGDGAHEQAPGNLDVMDGSSSLSQHGTREQVVELDSESDSDSNQDSNDGTQTVGPDEEQCKQNLSEAANAGEGSVLL